MNSREWVETDCLWAVGGWKHLTPPFFSEGRSQSFSLTPWVQRRCTQNCILSHTNAAHPANTECSRSATGTFHQCYNYWHNVGITLPQYCGTVSFLAGQNPFGKPEPGKGIVSPQSGSVKVPLTQQPIYCPQHSGIHHNRSVRWFSIHTQDPIKTQLGKRRAEGWSR